MDTVDLKPWKFDWYQVLLVLPNILIIALEYLTVHVSCWRLHNLSCKANF